MFWLSTANLDEWVVQHLGKMDETWPIALSPVTSLQFAAFDTIVREMFANRFCVRLETFHEEAIREHLARYGVEGSIPKLFASLRIVIISPFTFFGELWTVINQRGAKNLRLVTSEVFLLNGWSL